MPPRNSRLSAYYNLSPNASPSKPPTKSPTALPRTREEALSHAEHLTKTLPLAHLLSHATKQKEKTQALSHQLHTATLSHYQHLQSALTTSEHVHSLLTQLHPRTECVKEALEISKSINEKLRQTRETIRSLEAARTVELLLRAAELLTEDLPNQADQLPLCTDPDQLKASLTLSSRRFTCIRPALGKLAKADNDIKQSAKALDAAAERVCDALRGEQIVLSRGDAASVRLALHEDRANVETDFVRAVVEEVLSKSVNEKALSGLSEIGKSSRRVDFFVEEVCKGLLEDVRVYEELFGACSWVEDVVRDAMAEARHGVKGVLEDSEGLDALRVAMGKLGNTHEFGRVAAAELESVVRDVAKREAEEELLALVRGVGELGKKDIPERVKALSGKLENVLGWGQDVTTKFVGRVLMSHDGLSAPAAGMCQALIDSRWDLSYVRDMCVERTVEEVLLTFRRCLRDESNIFVEMVKRVDELRRRFDVVGLVDDELGEGFGGRVEKGVVEILRERGIDKMEEERLRQIAMDVQEVFDGFERGIDVVLAERRFDE